VDVLFYFIGAVSVLLIFGILKNVLASLLEVISVCLKPAPPPTIAEEFQCQHQRAIDNK